MPPVHVLDITEDDSHSLATARALAETDVVQQARAAAVDYLSATDPAVTSPSAELNLAELSHYVDELSLAMCMQAASMDPYRPQFYLTDTLGWRYGGDNPDTIYHATPVSADASYVLTGTRGSAPYLFFQVTNGFYADPRSGDDLTPDTVATLDGEDMVFDADGGFTVTLDASPANGRPNHIQLVPGSTLLTVRESLTDWSQTLTDMTIELISGPPSTPPTQEEMAAQCAQWTEAMARYAYERWSNLIDLFLPVNSLRAVGPTPNGLPGQRSSATHFDLASDEALVVTIERFGVDYLGIAVYNDWFASINYAAHVTSLAVDQAVPNADGSYTFVISAQDPGVVNWLDTNGHQTGKLVIRWQGIRGESPDGYTPRVETVNLADLATVLPDDMATLSPSDREAQIQRRQTELRVRFAGLPEQDLPFSLTTFTYTNGDPLM